VAFADPDWKQAAETFEKYPKVPKYKDFRQMLDKEKDIDAVTISTPDHVHAFAAMAAMERGKHVYVQKPMTRLISETRKLTEAARKFRVASQMGNQGHSNEGVRQLCEMIWAGHIGNVREVHAWTNRPIWPQGIAAPLPQEPIPGTMDWDIWLAASESRPYNSGYAPRNWRGWKDFGCGALGDMACHVLDGVNWAMKLTAPVSVECVRQEQKNPYTFPTKSIIRFDFAARGNMPPLTVYWYDGELLPPRPEGIGPDTKLGDGHSGSIFVGDKGVVTTGTYGAKTRLLPIEKMKDYKFPEPVLPRSPGHYRDWIRACKGGVPACSNFDYAGPFTEWVLLGVVALKCEGKLQWDSKAMKVTNMAEANRYITGNYRKGWKL
jgi:predicted dehydrogenase